MNRAGNNGNGGAARSSTPKMPSRNTATPGLQNHQQQNQQQQNQQQQAARHHRATPPIHVNQPMVSPVQQHQQNHHLNQQQLQHLHLQQMQQNAYHVQGMHHQSNYLTSSMSGNGGINQSNVSGANVQSGYAQAQSPNAPYGSGQSTTPMPTVIQHRMTNSHSNLSVQNSLPSPHQRLGPSPSSCAVSSSNNFYVQGGHTSHTPGPIPTPTPSATPTPGMDQAICQQNSVGQHHVGHPSSLSKLQQLASLDIPNQVCNTPPSVVLTPPPHSHMTPSPSPHLHNQNRSISTPPQSSLQPQMTAALQYKFYGGNVPPSIGQNTGRNARTPAPPSVQHMAPAPSASRVSPNVTIGNMINMPYSYRMSGQQTGYITSPGFINANSSAQIPVMNMQSQYQDPSALQRAQQNSMYSAYPIYPATTMRR